MQSKRPHILLCSHGIYGGPGVTAVHAKTLAQRIPAMDIDVCCLLGAPNIVDISPEKTADLTVIPILMADGFTMNKLREAVADLEAERAAQITLTPPIGSLPGLTNLLIKVGLDGCEAQGWTPSQTNLLLAAHGSKRVSTTSGTTLYHLDRIAQRQQFASSKAAFLDQKPFIADTLAAWRGTNTVMVGLFTDAGPHGKDDLQKLAGQHGDTIHYTGPIGTDPGYANLIAAAIDQAKSVKPADLRAFAFAASMS